MRFNGIVEAGSQICRHSGPGNNSCPVQLPYTLDGPADYLAPGSKADSSFEPPIIVQRDFDPDANALYRPCLAPRTVGVIGSGSDAHPDLSQPLGRLLAALNVNLLTGGGRGVMEAVASVFVGAQPRLGISIGVIPSSKRDPTERVPGYPNPYVQLVISTHLPDRGRSGHLVTSRNHINILSSDVIVALPGSHGTESELRLAVEYNRKAAIFYSDPATIERFPPDLARYDRLADLESFLRTTLDFPADQRAG